MIQAITTCTRGGLWIAGQGTIVDVCKCWEDEEGLENLQLTKKTQN